jgi:hexosaminidase
MTCGAQSPAPAVTWRLTGNDVPTAGFCTAELVVEPSLLDANSDSESTLYFNFVRKPVADQNAAPGHALEHINGDLLRLKIPPHASDDALRFETIFEGAVRHITDAPAGFFVVTKGADVAESVQQVAVNIDLSVLRSGAKLPADLEQEKGRSTPLRASVADENPSAPWIPQPRHYEQLPGVVSLNELPIECASDHAAAAQLLSDAIVAAGGKTPTIKQVVDPSLPAIRLRLGEVSIGDPATDSSNEAYSLEAREESGIVSTGSGPAGLYYGVQSLVATLANAAVEDKADDGPAIREMIVRDAPHFRYRGLHLDVARNFHSAATVRKLLDLMAAYKLNRFHFHLTDDEGWRLAIQGLPELTEVGGRRGYSPGFQGFLPPSFGSGPNPDGAPGSGYYTREEFVELLRYAAERHIEIIPEIDLPGHSRAAIRAMQVRSERFRAAGDEKAAEQFLLRREGDTAKYESVQMWDDNVIDVRMDSALAFVEHIVGDVASMYVEAGVPFKTIHLGGDEVPRGCWGDSSDPKTAEQPALFASFMDRCSEIAASHGARSAGWEEVFLTEGIGAALRPGASARGLCYAWNNIWGWRQEDAAYRLANASADVVLCNATHLYFDLAYEDTADEPGYYWAGATDLKEVFGFQPYSYFDAPISDRLGNPIPDADKQTKTRLTAEGRRHIVGMQGHLWGENLNSAERLESMAFPRVLALAEIAWAGPSDSRAGANPSRTLEEFSRHVTERELPRLDRCMGGVKYRPPSKPVRGE